MLILEGTSTIEFEVDGNITDTYTFSQREAWVGAADVWHNASNKTDQPSVVFVVFMGAEGLENTINR